MTTMPEGAQHTDALHVARSRLIDAFGEAEGALVAMLRGENTKILLAPLSQKIAAVRKITPSPTYSKSRRDEVHKALDKLAALLVRRAELAHSPMRLVRIVGDSEDRAGFVNPASQPEHGEAPVLYRRQEMVDLAKEVQAIGRDLAGRT